MKKILLTLARILRLYAIALWVGGLIFFVVVAAVSFGNLPSTHEAGIVVRHSLLALHDLGTYAGFVYIIATLFVFFLGDRSRLRGVEVMLVFAMMMLTAYSQHGIIPQMEADRNKLDMQYHAEVDQTPKDDPAHADFDRLHNVSTKVEGVVLFCGLAVLAMGALPGKVE